MIKNHFISYNEIRLIKTKFQDISDYIWSLVKKDKNNVLNEKQEVMYSLSEYNKECWVAEVYGVRIGFIMINYIPYFDKYFIDGYKDHALCKQYNFARCDYPRKIMEIAISNFLHSYKKTDLFCLPHVNNRGVHKLLKRLGFELKKYMLINGEHIHALFEKRSELCLLCH